MKSDFIKRVQGKGWKITSATEDSVTAACPSAGCGMKAILRDGAHVPNVDPNCSRNPVDQPIISFDDIRQILRARREELSLTIREVEEIAGIAVDFLAKFEKENPSKYPNTQTVIEWAQSIGYQLVLRPMPLSPYAVRVICDTRSKVETRRRSRHRRTARR